MYKKTIKLFDFKSSNKHNPVLNLGRDKKLVHFKLSKPVGSLQDNWLKHLEIPLSKSLIGYESY